MFRSVIVYLRARCDLASKVIWGVTKLPGRFHHKPLICPGSSQKALIAFAANSTFLFSWVDIVCFIYIRTCQNATLRVNMTVTQTPSPLQDRECLLMMARTRRVFISLLPRSLEYRKGKRHPSLHLGSRHHSTS